MTVDRPTPLDKEVTDDFVRRAHGDFDYIESQLSSESSLPRCSARKRS